MTRSNAPILAPVPLAQVKDPLLKLTREAVGVFHDHSNIEDPEAGRREVFRTEDFIF